MFEPSDPWFPGFRLDKTLIFTFLAFPNQAQKTSRLEVVKNVIWGSKLSLFLKLFGTKNSSRNQKKNKLDQKLEKSDLQGPWVALAVHQPMDLDTRFPAGGVGGVNNQFLLII